MTSFVDFTIFDFSLITLVLPYKHFDTMKLLLSFALLMVLSAGCTPDPTCQASTFKYEVTVSTSVPVGHTGIYYTNEYGTEILDTTLTTGWTKEVMPAGSGNFTSSLMLFGLPHSGQPDVNTTATLNIYRDGDLIESSGPVEFCSGITCSVTSVNEIQQTHVCTE